MTSLILLNNNKSLGGWYWVFENIDGWIDGWMQGYNPTTTTTTTTLLLFLYYQTTLCWLSAFRLVKVVVPSFKLCSAFIMTIRSSLSSWTKEKCKKRDLRFQIGSTTTCLKN
ncbi:hypothetical protein DFA_12118 [Cavenderia fasciculata]|uniref:Uncharacterized protein n=1 Tax=Cavenderia fasciculata TaxID=261658 RepID=F4QFV1_CACFS|nr:uncharacterized protein DFA_12118 [Cavenderia fasciculata]EGG14348.1 hypothetical protein DFA_12118 [Cavenderia fasciculata]|eukprot:XP_004351060.1 hypothetical protein DFA_12118 [Cavenderia fasciculata]